MIKKAHPFTGARLAATCAGFVMSCSICSASGLLNYTNMTYNETAEAVVIINPYDEIQILLLAIIALCNLFLVLTKIQGWFLNDNN